MKKLVKPKKAKEAQPKKYQTALIVTHYESSDEECDGDYYDIELFIDNKLVKTFGDYYHDKGEERVDAFIEGVEFTQGSRLKVSRKSVADRG